jgi:catechol 2,3-dioxygenase-like lactoylglutathione lyase family enzyme
MGVASFLTTSGGKHLPNPRHLAATAGRLAAAQRDLTRKKRGSSRRKRAVAKVARLHGKVRRQRLHHAHTNALALVRAHDLIVHEDLQITNMTARPKPRPDGADGYEPNGAAAKAGLNKSIHDAGWGIFLQILSAKAESAGRTVIAVNPRHTSQRCAECGHTAAGNRVTQEAFRCLACGHQAHADVNAARNILRAGLAPLGAQRIMDFSVVIGYGVPPRPDFRIGARSTGDGFRESHVAFTAPSRAAVNAFFDAAVAVGAEPLHEPRVWPEYHATYYGAFVRDPDGNNVEAVCHPPGNGGAAPPRAVGGGRPLAWAGASSVAVRFRERRLRLVRSALAGRRGGAAAGACRARRVA